jgi:N-methylhydantoinase A
LASRQLAVALSLDRVLTFDMGGTTAKAGTIIGGAPDVSYEFEAAGRSHSGRSIKGSGYAVRTPFIDLAEVSAGGGTLAWVDEGGALQVGPASAGAEPGPAAYGKGGKRPTVTDANVVLGRINPEHLLGGKMPIFAGLARKSMKALSDATGLAVEKAAEAVIRVVDNNMAKAISIVSVERGRDPREFAMVAFGGAGPLHCCNLAEALGFRRVIVPVHAGLFSASGLLAADVSRTFVLPVMSTNGNVGSFFDELEGTARKALRSEGFARYALSGFADVRYRGQSHELTIPCRRSSDVRRLFGRKHRTLYGYDSPDEIEIVNLRLRARIRMSRMAKRLVRHEKVRPSPSHSRRVWFGGTPAMAPVHVREEARPGSSGTGPCVIEEYDSTLVVNRGWAWTIEDHGTELSR